MRNLPSLAWDAEFLVSGIEKILNQDFFFFLPFGRKQPFAGNSDKQRRRKICPGACIKY